MEHYEFFEIDTELVGGILQFTDITSLSVSADLDSFGMQVMTLAVVSTPEPAVLGLAALPFVGVMALVMKKRMAA